MRRSFRPDQPFLSTPSARRATSLNDWAGFEILISIHALREEGDLMEAYIAVGGTIFLSTPSARRATLPAVPEVQAGVMSIHALREEGDSDTGCTS